ncbi:MAG TPA: hypothetical protein ENN81_11405 [Phycisphaerales bacterium]|nr:hypothetical protein [Phycisphaerales bacterium]
MPGGDGTGPLGYGPMTGRGAGYCAGYGAPGAFGPLGRGRGRGRGRGLRFGPVAYHGPGAAPLPGEQELQMLRDQAQQMQQSLEGINRRISQLEQHE